MLIAINRLAAAFLFFTAFTFGISETVLALTNPASSYCEQLGFSFAIQKDNHGAETGFCLLPDKSMVNAWDFYRGKAGQSFSYCARYGYGTSHRSTVLQSGFRTESAVCVESGGAGKQARQVDMLDLMQQNGDFVISQSSLRTHDTRAATPAFESLKMGGADLPVSFDWRNRDGRSYIGPVRDQGGCGDCYAFGAVAAAEGAYNITEKKYGNDTADFSESFIAWCLGAYGPYSEHFAGCEGADYEYAELTALTKEGVTWERYFPYTEVDPGSCTHNKDPRVSFARWGRIDPNNISEIKKAIFTYGVLDVAVLVDGFFSLYSGGVYSDDLTTCPEGAYTTTNHAVALVGWGVDSQYGEYWLLRNSWGPDWGENGYMKITTTSARVGCSATFLTYSRDSLPPLPAIDFLLQKGQEKP